jgi:hypothetical protein
MPSKKDVPKRLIDYPTRPLSVADFQNSANRFSIVDESKIISTYPHSSSSIEGYAPQK